MESCRISVLALVGALAACQPQIAAQDFSFGTEYQAVVLTNGQVFYGRIEQLDRPFPVLRDVYYIASQTDPDTKQTKGMLLKRGREPHGPAFMHINAQHIAVIEPVAPESRIAQLIAESRKQPPAASSEPAPAASTQPAPQRAQ